MLLSVVHAAKLYKDRSDLSSTGCLRDESHTCVL